MGEEYYMNLSIGIAGLVISTLGLIQVLISPHFERWTRKFFIAFFSIMVAIAVCNLTGQLATLYSDPTHARIFRITLFWESLLPSFLMVLLTVFCSGQAARPIGKETESFTSWQRCGSHMSAY